MVEHWGEMTSFAHGNMKVCVCATHFWLKIELSGGFWRILSLNIQYSMFNIQYNKIWWRYWCVSNYEEGGFNVMFIFTWQLLGGCFLHSDHAGHPVCGHHLPPLLSPLHYSGFHGNPYGVLSEDPGCKFEFFFKNCHWTIFVYRQIFALVLFLLFLSSPVGEFKTRWNHLLSFVLF